MRVTDEKNVLKNVATEKNALKPPHNDQIRIRNTREDVHKYRPKV